MGTTFMVEVVTETLGEERQAEVLELIEAELDEVNTKMSHYLEDSELSRFNRSRDTSPFAVSEETLEVFRHAQELARLSSGAFDVTVGPLVDAWGFGPEERVIEPSEPRPDEVIGRLLAHVGYTKIELDLEHSTIRKTEPSVACDLSAIAKGYGVDQVSEALRREGFGDHLVEVGGEVRAAGLNAAGQPWRIAIERPGSGGAVPGRIVPLSNLAMATSGDYRNYYEVGGVRFSHTIDPRTGYPISHALASVSVVDELSVRADGLATALAVLGPDEGYELAVEQDLAALFIVRDGEGGFRERATPAFERLVGATGDSGPSHLGSVAQPFRVAIRHPPCLLRPRHAPAYDGLPLAVPENAADFRLTARRNCSENVASL